MRFVLGGREREEGEGCSFPPFHSALTASIIYLSYSWWCCSSSRALYPSQISLFTFPKSSVTHGPALKEKRKSKIFSDYEAMKKRMAMGRCNRLLSFVKRWGDSMTMTWPDISNRARGQGDRQGGKQLQRSLPPSSQQAWITLALVPFLGSCFPSLLLLYPCVKNKHHWQVFGCVRVDKVCMQLAWPFLIPFVLLWSWVELDWVGLLCLALSHRLLTLSLPLSRTLPGSRISLYYSEQVKRHGLFGHLETRPGQTIAVTCGHVAFCRGERGNTERRKERRGAPQLK